MKGANFPKRILCPYLFLFKVGPTVIQLEIVKDPGNNALKS